MLYRTSLVFFVAQETEAQPAHRIQSCWLLRKELSREDRPAFSFDLPSTNI